MKRMRIFNSELQFYKIMGHKYINYIIIHTMGSSLIADANLVSKSLVLVSEIYFQMLKL